MSESFVSLLFLFLLLLPCVMYLASKLSRRFDHVAYELVGAVCLVAAVAFFATAGWVFFTTGVLVVPHKYGPSTIVVPSETIFFRILAAAFALVPGIALVLTGVSMVRLKRAPPSRLTVGWSSPRVWAAHAKPLGHKAFDFLNRDIIGRTPYGHLSRSKLHALEASVVAQIGATYMQAAGKRLSASAQIHEAEPITAQLVAIRQELVTRDLRWARERGLFFALAFFGLLGATLFVVSLLIDG